jgi:hypothetical protein
MLRPYTADIPALVECEYPVQVVGHHDAFVQCDVREVPRDLKPTPQRCPPGSAQANLPLDHVSKHVLAHLNADCDEVDAFA